MQSWKVNWNNSWELQQWIWTGRKKLARLTADFSAKNLKINARRQWDNIWVFKVVRRKTKNKKQTNKEKTKQNCKPRFLHLESNLTKMKGNTLLHKQTLREIVASKPAMQEILK